jgi:lycopene cyclase domain-containing protein
MTTYLVLNLLFLLSIVFFLPKRLSRPSRAFWITLASVVALTAVFDPIIVALDIVGYDASKLLGIRWFGAPVEDFFYAVYAVIIVPLIWHKLGESRHAR